MSDEGPDGISRLSNLNEFKRGKMVLIASRNKITKIFSV